MILSMKKCVCLQALRTLCLRARKTNGESSSSVHLVSKPQFSPFFGFSDGDKNKGVAYNVWRFEVESVIKRVFYPDEVILEQIRRSLQGEAKAKIVGFGSETSCESILGKLHQFYSDVSAATGDELLAEAYQMKQGEHEEVAAFASRLDSRVRWAKRRGTEILPDDDSVERQLRMLFWGGIKESRKDKTRHKKDNCKTFAELITAARYEEKELGTNQSTRKFARANQAIYQEPGQTSPSQPRNDGDKKEWIAEIGSAMAKEVREVLKDQAKPTDARNVGDERKDCDHHGGDGQPKYRPVTGVDKRVTSKLAAETLHYAMKGRRETNADLCQGATRGSKREYKCPSPRKIGIYFKRTYRGCHRGSYFCQWTRLSCIAGHR